MMEERSCSGHRSGDRFDSQAVFGSIHSTCLSAPSRRLRDGSVVSSLHCMNDPHRRVTDVIELGSIEELAALFEQRAKAARDRIGLHTPNMRIALLREQARIWEDAARTVRGITIVTKSRARKKGG
jgi:hypothetical protein